jgi:hypothetical protein
VEEKARTEAVAGNGGGVWRDGVAAGVLAALAMMAFMMLAAALDGTSDLLDPLRAVGTSFRGADASPVGALPVVWGMVLHLAVGAAFGAAFASIFPRDLSLAAGAVLGGGCALLAMGLALTAIVPAVAPGLDERMPPQGGAWVIAHAIFGAVAGLGPWLHRRLRERRGRRAPDARGVLRPRTSP